MIRLPAFTYLAPRTLDDAAAAMASHGAEAMLVAGGTDLYPNMKRRQFEPTVLVGLRAIRDLQGVRGGARDGITIGAGTTLSAVAAHREIIAHYPALATAAGLVSSPQLRNMGTLGGNVCVDTRCNYYNQSYEWRKAVGFCMKKDGAICLVAPGSPRCWAVSSSDTAPVLWSLGARVRLSSTAGERTIPVEALYRDDGIEYLAKQPGRGASRPAARPRRSRDHARRAHQGSPRRARAAAAPARREGGAHAEYGVADRVRAAHALAPHARPGRRGARCADRRAV